MERDGVDGKEIIKEEKRVVHLKLDNREEKSRVEYGTVE